MYARSRGLSVIRIIFTGPSYCSHFKPILISFYEQCGYFKTLNFSYCIKIMRVYNYGYYEYILSLTHIFRTNDIIIMMCKYLLIVKYIQLNLFSKTTTYGLDICRIIFKSSCTNVVIV